MKNPMRVVDSKFDRLQATKGTATKNGSQMDKIVSVLQIGSKAGPDDAQVLAKAEKRVTALRELRENLVKATTAVSRLYIVPKAQQLKRLSAALKAVKAIAENKPPVGVSKHLKAAINELTSLREGVYVGAASSKKTLSLISCVDAVQHVDELLVKAEETYAAKKATAGVDDPLFADDIKDLIKQSAEETAKLPSLKDRDFFCARVPVVMVSKGFLSIDAISRAGFKASSLGGYPVIHNQLVIGINPKGTKTGQKSMGEKGTGQSIPPAEVRAAADRIRKLIEKETKTKLQFVDDRAYGSAGGAWFWLMLEKDLNRFASTFPGKAIAIKTWGLAGKS